MKKCFAWFGIEAGCVFKQDIAKHVQSDQTEKGVLKSGDACKIEAHGRREL